MTDDERRRLAAQVRDACIVAAERAYEDAAMAGLCGEGALEAAIGAIRDLDPDMMLLAPADEKRPPR